MKSNNIKIIRNHHFESVVKAITLLLKVFNLASDVGVLNAVKYVLVFASYDIIVVFVGLLRLNPEFFRF